MRWNRRLAAGLAVLGLSACTGTPAAPQTTTSTDPTGGVHTVVSTPTAPVTTATPKPKNDFIRASNFGAVEWLDALSGKKFTLAGGKASVDKGTASLGKDAIVYADANGDGMEDALVPLVVDYGNGPVTYLYAWLWDTKNHKAVQVEDPVGEYSSCGHAFDSAKPGSPMGFEITEYIRDQYDNLACGVKSNHKFTRTVGVDQGALVMTKPVLGYGGVCYQTYRDTTQLPTKLPIRVSPSAGAMVAENAQNVYFTIPTSDGARTWGNGWRQVSWLTEDMKKKGLYWGVCGFIPPN